MKHSFFTGRVAFLLCAASATNAVYAEGFFDDAKVNLNLRNFYMNRDFVDNGRSVAVPGPTNRGMAEEWTQSFILDVKSGYTPGVVGFGVDAIGMLAIKLDGGRGTYGTQLLPTHDDNRPADDFGRLAVAGKAKFSNTELKIGEWAPIIPLLRSDDARSLPQTFEGGMITSKEITNTTLYAGRFTGNSQRNDASMQKLSFNNAGTVVHGRNTIESDRFNFGGAEYTFNQQNTLVGAWYGQLEDIYTQTYLQLNHTQPVTDNLSLGANIGYFFGNEDGEALAGTQDNKTFSGLFSLKTGAHTFYVGLQKVAGDAGVQRINGTSGTSLANDSFAWSYDGKHEKSWQVRYDYNFAGLGIPGLTMMNRFIKGTDVHAGAITDGEDRGRETEVGYVVQSGVLKAFNVRLRQSTLRRDYGNTNSFNETRIIVQYPISIF